MPNSPVRMSTSAIEDPESPRIKGELELLREKNIRERDAYLTSLMNNPEFAEIVGSLNTLTKSNNNKPPRTKRSLGNIDPSFRSNICIPLERRKSARLENKPPIFTKDDLIEESYIEKKRYNNDYSDLEEIVYLPRISNGVIRRKVPHTSRICIPVEHVTEEMVNNIARRVSTKIYSDIGTSCHQCRQKTKDQKTCCRNVNCVGIRGQFCGVCLENRYGEDAAVALRDPDWFCPVCRGICNCSFCRAKAGKRPTGILTPQALQAGHKSVKDFLDSLKGEGDYPHQDTLWKNLNNPKNLLGFSKDLSIAYMGGGSQFKVESVLRLEKMQAFLQQLKENLSLSEEQRVDRHNLLGFDGDTAYLNNDIQINMGCSFFPVRL